MERRPLCGPASVTVYGSSRQMGAFQTTTNKQSLYKDYKFIAMLPFLAGPWSYLSHVCCQKRNVRRII